MWAPVKELLGFEFDGNPGRHTIALPEVKRLELIATLEEWLHRARTSPAEGVPFEEFNSKMEKVRHAFTAVPAGRGLLSAYNRVLGMKPARVYLHRNPPLSTAVRDCRAFLRDSLDAPTPCRELTPAWPSFVGVKDASGHGVGGVILGEGAECVPTVFRLEWPREVKDLFAEGSLTNSDLECAGLVLLFLVMEEVCPWAALRVAHVALFSDNQPTVSWVERLATRASRVAAQLLRVLAFRMHKQAVSPLTTMHVAGVRNSMTDMPSRSFGSEPRWHCRTEGELRAMMDSHFPLPKQNSWTVFRVSSRIATKLTSALRMTPFELEEWLRLPPIGRSTSPTGRPTSGLFDWSLTFRERTTSSHNAPSPASPPASGQEPSAGDDRSALAQCLGRSLPLERRSLWPEGPTPRNSKGQTSSRHN